MRPSSNAPLPTCLRMRFAMAAGARYWSARGLVGGRYRGPRRRPGTRASPAAERERIFEPFYRGESADQHAGSGLGLAIARGFVEANGGEIAVESLPGQGTSFVVSLPPAAQVARVTALGRRVLVCDDEPQILRALRVILRDAGYEAVAGRAPARRRSTVAAVKPPEAAILDLMLPDIDGVEVTERLREWSEMPIIVLSAVGEEEAKVRALAAGADDYVTKPFGPPRADRPAGGGACAVRGPRREEPKIVAEGLEIDLAARAVRRDGEAVHLTPTEFEPAAASSPAIAGG